MNTIFKSLVGAAALVGVMASGASAQDYTWTLQNFEFGGMGPAQGTAASLLTGDDPGTASGTVTFRRNSANNYSLLSFNVVTTAGTATNFQPSGISYVSGTDNQGSVEAGSNAYRNFVEFLNVDAGTPVQNSYRFRLTWADSALWNEMENTPAVGDTVGLLFTSGSGVALTREFRTTLGSHPQRAMCGGASAPCEVTPSLRLSNITEVAVPEPASMAVLGAGLLGLYAARRRRRA